MNKLSLHLQVSAALRKMRDCDVMIACGGTSSKEGTDRHQLSLDQHRFLLALSKERARPPRLYLYFPFSTSYSSSPRNELFLDILYLSLLLPASYLPLPRNEQRERSPIRARRLRSSL